MKTTSYAPFLYLLLLILALSGCDETIEDYPAAIQWNDAIYHGSGAPISEEEIGNEIGSIIKNVSKYPENNGEANAYPAGSPIFEVKGHSVTETIAIEENGQYQVFNKD